MNSQFNDIPESPEIRTQPCSTCISCGKLGAPLYFHQKDRLFGASGNWDSKQCPDRNCGLIWLDPMPLKEDLGKAYRSYYTHKPATDSDPGYLKSLLRLAERTYVRNKYGYTPVSNSSWHRYLPAFLYLSPIRRYNLEVGIRFLHAIKNGKVLDVGCGAGEWLISMRELGWEVQGVDFDPAAVDASQKSGLKVNYGSVEEQQLAAASFDAITLNHVIEHVPDPLVTLQECFRLLKKGGKLIVVTPNGSSLSHRYFKEDWRGLETPRHLHIFSHPSLKRTMVSAGFKEVTIKPQIVRSIPYESYLIRACHGNSLATSRNNRKAKVFAHVFNMIELLLLPWNPAVADCIVAIAVKQ